MKHVIYSWVLPIRDEAESLPQLLEEIKEAMASRTWEVIAVNDASTDDTANMLRTLRKKIPQLRVTHFPSHQGKWAALKEGFAKAKGDIIITADSDLQDDPKEVNKLLDKLERGFDVVSGWRVSRSDPFYKVFISKFGNWLAARLTGRDFKDLNSPLKVYKRDVFSNLPAQGSLLRFSLLFADKLGYRVSEVPVLHRARLFGKSKFGVVKYARIIYDLLLVLLLFSGSGRIASQGETLRG